VASALDVVRVCLSLVLLLRLLDELHGSVDVALQEVGPGQVLVYLVVPLVVVQTSLVGPLGLVEVLVLFVEQTDLEQGVHLPLHCEGVREDGVLEVTDGLLDLVGLGEYHA
jgi:hypothetical protein